MMNGKKRWIFSLAFLSCFLLTDNVRSQVEQCTTHSPTEYGKNLVAHMLQNPPHRWSGTTMNYWVNTSTSYWYGTDIAAARDVWNNSSYKGTATAFRFVYAGGTQLSPDNQDGVNVVGFKNLGPDIGAQTHYWYVIATGKIVEADIMINSLSWTNIQPHATAGPNDFCVRNSLVHEFGHALGLRHLFPEQSVEYIPDVMYFKKEKGEHNEQLHCDDKWGIWYTYDSGNVPSPNAPPLHQVPDLSWAYTLSHIEKGTIPAVTELVGNYPNPFNPETWIAYKLAQVSEVAIRIYDTKGKVIRTIQLGTKSAGAYVDKESAAYWDGKTDAGEEVSSGLYFYSLITDQAMYTKRMVIAK
ncbi:T9SS type A sorting domain-containing protein [Candidatus Poribacteria bacterium]|nr:T9SS type A sorting domain-containing protein [Candidatus Poribacteria bacterium]